MILSDHARLRMKQRAIPADWLALLTCFGMEQACGGDCDRVALPRREAEQLRRRLRALLQRWDQLADAYLIATPADLIITTAHRKRKPMRHRPRNDYGNTRGNC